MYLFLISFLILKLTTAQYTGDCGTDYGCFRVPENCQNSQCKYIVKWQDFNSYNRFVLMTYVNETSVFDAWTAIGFSNDMLMGSDSVVMCRLSSYAQEGKIETYYNQVHMSGILQTANPSMGLFDQQIEVFGRYLVCRFSRQKSFLNVANYYDLNSPNKYNILVASGATNYLGNPVFHGSNGYFAGQYKQSFETLITAGPETTTTTTTTTKSPYHTPTSPKKKTHSCLMIFAWIFFASIAILMPKYYKYLFRPSKACGSHVWFIIHVTLMVFVAVLNLIALLVILSDLDWKWISTDDTLSFIHSIFGMITMGLLYLQLLIGLCHPSKESGIRKFYKLIHGFFGYSILILSVITMFLGVLIKDMNLSRIGWGIMAGWAGWIIILVLIMEILKLTRLGAKNRGSAYKMSGTLRENYEKLDRYTRIFNGLKSFILFVHILIALGITLGLVIIIGLSDSYYW